MRLRFVPDVTHINFFAPWAMRFWLAVSAIGMVGSVVLFLTVGLNYGVDFRGGTIMMVSTPEAVPVGDYRTLLTKLNFGEVGVTEVSDNSGADRHMMLMRLGIAGDDPDSQQAVIAQVQEALTAAHPDIQFLQVDSVGAKVSGELVRSGVLAVALSFIGIMIYIWLRFEWQFALGAVASLVHDAILVVGVFSLLQLEFNLTIIAAILTVIGYSINDTVVVFDRVREVLRKYKKMPLADVMNLALNETLSRTVMTSTTTLIALLAIYFFGGRRGVGLCLRGDLRRADRDLLVDLRGERRGALLRGQARLVVEVGRQGGDQLRQRRGLRRVRTTEIDFESRLPIDGYAPGGFRVAGTVYRGPIGLVPAGVIDWGGLPDLGPFLERAAEFDVLLVGLGAAMGPLPEGFVASRAALEAAGVGVDPMATPSACRTFNVLLGEGRRVAAALMPV